MYTTSYDFAGGFLQCMKLGTPTWPPINTEGRERAHAGATNTNTHTHRHTHTPNTHTHTPGTQPPGPLGGHLKDSNLPRVEPLSETLLRNGHFGFLGPALPPATPGGCRPRDGIRGGGPGKQKYKCRQTATTQGYDRALLMGDPVDRQPLRLLQMSRACVLLALHVSLRARPALGRLFSS